MRNTFAKGKSKEKCSGRIGIICVTTFLLMMFSVSIGAQEVNDVKLKIESVALFKNGLGYFTSTSTLPRKATTIKFGQLPVPSLGTFWVGYPKGVKVRALFTNMEDVKETVPARSIAHLFQVNISRKVVVHTGSKDVPMIEGIIVEVTPQENPQELPSPYLMDIRRGPDNQRYRSYQVNPLVVLKTEQGIVAINAGSINRVDFADDDINTSIPVVLKRPSIRMELEKPAGRKKIGISYLARGITWSPSYLIDLSDPKIALLSAKALVINEVDNLDGVRLELVTGFPNIQFADVNSPIAMSQKLAGFLQALTTGRSESRRGRGNIMTQQRAVMSNLARFESSMPDVPMPGYSTAQEGTVSEDLFLYPVEDFSLLRDETACIPLFTAEVPYKHIYIWKIDDMLDKDERYRRDREQDGQPQTEEVWHSCRLTNNMKMPWTTAAAEFVKGAQFIGQDICYYTAPGAETTIRINRAMNVIAEQAEFELERKRNAARFYGYNYDLVKVKGELKLRNRLDKIVNVEVTKNLSGEVSETTPQAKDIPTAKGLKRVNPRHILIWDIELNPSKEQTLLYTYEVYIRN